MSANSSKEDSEKNAKNMTNSPKAMPRLKAVVEAYSRSKRVKKLRL